MTNVIDLPIAHEDGSFVSARVSRVVELIREYDPKLDVRWIPPAARTGGEAAFCIVEETEVPGEFRTIMLVKTEDEMDERVLAQLYSMDAHKNDIKARSEALHKAYKDMQRKQWEDRMEQAADEARFLWRTPLHTVRFKGKKLEL